MNRLMGKWRQLTQLRRDAYNHHPTEKGLKVEHTLTQGNQWVILSYIVNSYWMTQTALLWHKI